MTMEWFVIDALYLRTTDSWVLTLRAANLKMLAETASASPVQAGDILYPVRDALYLINRNAEQPLKVTRATAFSATQWRFLKKLSDAGQQPQL